MLNRRIVLRQRDGRGDDGEHEHAPHHVLIVAPSGKRWVILVVGRIRGRRLRWSRSEHLDGGSDPPGPRPS